MRVFAPASGMPTGIVVLGPGPRLLREVLRAMLQDDPSRTVVDAAEDGAWRGAAVHGEVTHVVVGTRDAAAALAQSVAPQGAVVVVSDDGRWAGRFVQGRLDREVEEVSPEGVRGLVSG